METSLISLSILPWKWKYWLFLLLCAIFFHAVKRITNGYYCSKWGAILQQSIRLISDFFFWIWWLPNRGQKNTRNRKSGDKRGTIGPSFTTEEQRDGFIFWSSFEPAVTYKLMSRLSFSGVREFELLVIPHRTTDPSYFNIQMNYNRFNRQIAVITTKLEDTCKERIHSVKNHNI